jgi:acyl dehydratase
MAKVGQEFPPYYFTVERGKIKEFAQAIGDDNPIYSNPEAAKAAGYKDVIAPPTFLTCVDFWAGPDLAARSKILEIDPLKVLHGEQEYEYFSEIYPGDELVCTSKITEVYTKEGRSGKMLFIVTAKEFKRQDEVIAICRTSTVVRGG